MTTYLVATIRSDDMRHCKVIAEKESQWNYGKASEQGFVETLWRVTAAATKEEAIAAVINNAVGIGNAVTCSQPLKRDRSYLLTGLRKLLLLTRGDPTDANLFMNIADAVRGLTIDAEGLPRAVRPEAQEHR